MKDETILSIVALIVFGLVLISLFIFGDWSEDQKKEFSCDAPFDVIFIKPSEISYSSEFLNKHENGIVVIPEWNQVNANTKVLNCPNVNLQEFLTW